MRSGTCGDSSLEHRGMGAGVDDHVVLRAEEAKQGRANGIGAGRKYQGSRKLQEGGDPGLQRKGRGAGRRGGMALAQSGKGSGAYRRMAGEGEVILRGEIQPTAWKDPCGFREGGQERHGVFRQTGTGVIWVLGNSVGGRNGPGGAGHGVTSCWAPMRIWGIREPLAGLVRTCAARGKNAR